MGRDLNVIIQVPFLFILLFLASAFQRQRLLDLDDVLHVVRLKRPKTNIRVRVLAWVEPDATPQITFTVVSGVWVFRTKRSHASHHTWTWTNEII